MEKYRFQNGEFIITVEMPIENALKFMAEYYPKFELCAPEENTTT